MDLDAIRKMSRFHSLSSVVYIAVEQAGLDDSADKELLHAWENEQFYVLYREEAFRSEREKLLAFCKNNAIWYMPLKGILLKDYHPYPGMRQMADNDILFDENHREQIHQWFIENGYVVDNYKKGNHDVYFRDNVTFEMHIELFGVGDDLSWRDYYANVKERLLPNEGSAYGYHFKDEDFYVYITMHEYKNYCNGSFGLRFLLDDYVYLKEKEQKLDWRYIDGELKRLKVVDFEKKVRSLSGKLFSGNFDVEMLTMEEEGLLTEILQSGMSGSVEGHIRKRMEILNGGEQKGKRRYVWKRLFPSLVYMREYFPLCRYPVLIPFVYIYRIIYKLITQKDKLKKEIETLIKI